MVHANELAREAGNGAEIGGGGVTHGEAHAQKISPLCFVSNEGRPLKSIKG